MDSFGADVPTMLVMVIIASLLMSAALTVAGGGQEREGLALWALVLLLNAVGHALLALRGHIPDALSIVVANTLLSCVFAGMILAVFQFQRRALYWPLVMAPVILVLGLLLVFIDDFHARVSAVGLVCSAQAVWGLWAVFERRRATVGRGDWLLMAGLGLEALVLLTRAIVAVSLPASQIGLLQSSGMQTLTFMTTFCAVLLISIGFVIMARDRADENNRVLAAEDALTGTATRRALLSALDRDVLRAIRTQTPIAVLMVDIDHFKMVNDRYGHLAGDQVLRTVAGVLQERVRSQDLVGRYGGEEFLVVLPDTPLAGALHLAQELREAVQSLRCSTDAASIGVTVSIGVFGGFLKPGDGWDLLIDAADHALYQAKENGRNRVEVALQLRNLPTPADARGNPENSMASVL